MKVQDVAKKYNISNAKFETYLRTHHLNIKDTLLYAYIDDQDIDSYVKMYLEEKEREDERQKYEEEHKAELEEERARVEQMKIAEKKAALSKMLISSGFAFEGYRITKYSGYISGDDAVQIPRTWSFLSEQNGQNLTDALVKIRRHALGELKEAAYDLGCNAVIGVDFDYITLEPETASLTGKTVYQPYVICVTANGNAVIIEKD